MGHVTHMDESSEPCGCGVSYREMVMSFVGPSLLQCRHMYLHVYIHIHHNRHESYTQHTQFSSRNGEHKNIKVCDKCHATMHTHQFNTHTNTQTYAHNICKCAHVYIYMYEIITKPPIHPDTNKLTYTYIYVSTCIHVYRYMYINEVKK